MTEKRYEHEIELPEYYLEQEHKNFELACCWVYAVAISLAAAVGYGSGLSLWAVYNMYLKGI